MNAQILFYNLKKAYQDPKTKRIDIVCHDSKVELRPNDIVEIDVKHDILYINKQNQFGNMIFYYNPNQIMYVTIIKEVEKDGE